MNIQAMMRQAQQMQKDMLKVKEEINNTVFDGESSLVKVEAYGSKKIKSVKINIDDSFDSSDIEILEDMIVVALNDAFAKVDKVTEQKLSKFGAGISGLL